MDKLSVKLSDNMQLRAAQSRLLQETAFEAGYKWAVSDKVVCNLGENYLGFTIEDGRKVIRYNSLEDSGFSILDVEEALERLQKPQFKVGDWVYAEDTSHRNDHREGEGIPLFQIKEIFKGIDGITYLRQKEGISTGISDILCRLATKEEIKEATSFKKGQWVTTLPNYSTGYASKAGAGYKPNYTFQIDRVFDFSENTILFPKDKNGIYSNYVRLATSEEIKACQKIILGNHRVEFNGNRIIAGCVSKTIDEVKLLNRIMVEFDLALVIHKDGTKVSQDQIYGILRRAGQ